MITPGNSGRNRLPRRRLLELPDSRAHPGTPAQGDRMSLHPVPANAPKTRRLLDAALSAAGDVVLGKERQIRLAVACLLARGHLLIEDLPGVGKTTLAHVLAQVLGLDFKRIQFTSD